ncbi:major capsid protein [Vibrio phage 1.293.O._10N.261.52.E1]|nr:major capsid protein [Vibrio phage 1.293.O._10N.261.52.E1]
MSYVYGNGDLQNVSRQTIYTSMLQRRFRDWLLGQRMINDRTSEFPDGDVAFFDQVGQRSLKSRAENTAVDFSKLDTSRIELRVTDQYQDGFYMTDEAKEDSWKSDMLWSANVEESMLAFDRQLESDILATANQQALGDQNIIAGHAHRAIGTGAGQTISLDDLRRMKLAFDKARVPAEGRVLLIDPSVEFTLNGLIDLTANVNNSNNDVTGKINTGFGSKNQFLTSFYGWNIVISHQLPRIESETIDGEAITGGVANIFMSMASADTTPFMGVIRRSPVSEFERNGTFRRDEWSMTSRWGFSLQRPESLGVLITKEAV